MKKLNESRIQAAAEYIKTYFETYGECPSYREIGQELSYSSLSLVKADIDRLLERGVLMEDDLGHLRLSHPKQEEQKSYHYPFLIMTNATRHPERMTEEEKILLQAQDFYLKGDWKECERLSRLLLKESDDLDVVFGAKLTLCWSSMYSGKGENWREFFKMMLKYEPRNASEKMEKELMAHFLSSALGDRQNCPSWLKEGKFTSLRREAYPLACLLFIAEALNDNPPALPRYLEPLCSIAATKQIDIAQVYMDLYLAIAYRYSGKEKEEIEHLKSAIQICRNHRWFTPLVEVRKSLGSIITAEFRIFPERIQIKIEQLGKEMSKGYKTLYHSVIGDNPVKDLTFREAEIVNYIKTDHSTKEIAKLLYLSPETVKYYLSSIYLKLNVSGRKELKALVQNYI